VGARNSATLRDVLEERAVEPDASTDPIAPIVKCGGVVQWMARFGIVRLLRRVIGPDFQRTAPVPALSSPGASPERVVLERNLEPRSIQDRPQLLQTDPKRIR